MRLRRDRRRAESSRVGSIVTVAILIVIVTVLVIVISVVAAVVSVWTVVLVSPGLNGTMLV